MEPSSEQTMAFVVYNKRSGEPIQPAAPFTHCDMEVTDAFAGSDQPRTRTTRRN